MNTDYYIDPHRFEIKKNGEQFFLLDALSHQAFSLNDSSLRIFSNLMKGFSFSQIIKNLQKEYPESQLDLMEKEVISFFSFLKEKEVILSQKEQGPPLAPPLRKVTLGITQRCNLECQHCLAGNNDTAEDVFSSQDFQSIAESIKVLGGQSVSLFGGEPLFREDFFSIAEIFLNLQFHVQVNTNGTLVTPTIAKKFKSLGFGITTLSLDGSKAEIHEALRGKNTFSPALRGIKNLLRENLPVLLSATINRFNFEDLSEMVLLAKKLNVQGIRFNDLHFGGRAPCFSAKLKLSAEEKQVTLKNIEALHLQEGDFISGSLLDQTKLLKKLKPPDQEFPKVIAPCGAAMGSICIRPDGKVTPCEILWDEVCGDLKRDSLKKIYLESKAMNDFRRPLLIFKEDLGKCQKCSLYSNCYEGHRCSPYFNPGNSLENQASYHCLSYSEAPH